MKKKFIFLISLFFVNLGIMFAQIPVSGNVIDETGEPVIGATILIRGTSQGTVTDIDGNFLLSVPNDEAILVVSYVGMIS